MSRMCTPWFHVKRAGEVALGECLLLPEHEARHAVQSLRLRTGDAVCAFDGAGAVVMGTLEIETPVHASKKRAPVAQIRVDSASRQQNPPIRVTLIAAACKGARLDVLIEKCTELGVSEIVIAAFERSVVHAREGAAGKLERTALEACKQSKRAHLPTISTGIAQQAAIDAFGEQAGDGAPVLFAHLAPDAEPLGSWIAARFQDWTANRPPEAEPTRVAVVIGPEGGLTETEVTELTARGATPVRLGSHILRVETAAIAAAAAFAVCMPPGD